MNSQTIAVQTTSTGISPSVSPKAKPSAASVAAGAAQKNNGRNKSVPAGKPGLASTTSATPTESSSKNEPKETSFRLDAPSAREVLLAGEFTDWEKAPIKMIKGGGGVWHAKKLLAPGRHLYRFLVDGEWRNDPTCSEYAPNPFGTTNSVLEI